MVCGGRVELTDLVNELLLTLVLDEETSKLLRVCVHVLGEALGRETGAQMQRFPEGGPVLRRIMRELDRDSSVAQGFFNRLEDMLTRPDVYLDSLEPGSVQAKLRGA